MSEPKKDPTTIADVADKAVTGLTNGITETVNAFKQLAPHAWEVLVRQQVIEGVTNLIVYLLGFVFLFIFMRTARWMADHEDYNGNKMGYFDSNPTSAIWPVLAAIFTGFVLCFQTFFFVPEYISKIINPEFHAGQYVIRNVGR